MDVRYVHEHELSVGWALVEREGEELLLVRSAEDLRAALRALAGSRAWVAALLLLPTLAQHPRLAQLALLLLGGGW